ncbi:MAG: efflux RND transporter permease subunit [Clostridiales bacterium]|nr:efflux RND transporter permease subunit [Clostridiales bacterium]
MLNSIIKFSLKNRLIVLLISGVLVLMGVVAIMRADVDIFPDLNAPTVTVMTEAPGLAAEEVEQLVTYPIETAVNGSTGVRRVRSSSTTGFSIVNVEFDWGTDIYVARQTVAEHIAGVADNFPPGVETPVMGPQSSILGEVLIIGLTADSTSMMELRSIADRVIRPRLLAVEGVSSVSVIGGDVKQMQIKLNTAMMKRYGVTLNAVLEACEGMTLNAAGSIINDYGNEYTIKGMLSTTNADDLMHNVVNCDSGETVTLGEIACVEIGAESPCIGKASVRGDNAVIITVTKQPHVGTIELNDKLIATVNQLQSTLPADLKVATDIFSQSNFIETSIGNLQQSLFEGAIFVIIVLFFFLMNLRTTIISVVALPMSILITVLVMYLMHININTMTLGGIAIAIGSLVDDCIVDVENVYKRLRENRRKPGGSQSDELTVVYEASREVRMPVLNSSLIIIASFMPLFFLSGIEGRMLIPLGIAFIIALTASTVVALTLTPVLCSYLLTGNGYREHLDREPKLTMKLKHFYSKVLSASESNPKTVFVSTALLLVIAIVMFFNLGRSFLPGFNEGSYTINVSTLPGISIQESDEIGRKAELLILSVPEIQTVARKTGRAELDEHALGTNVSEIEAPYKLNGRSRSEVSRELRDKLKTLPGCNIEVGQPISHRIDAMLSGTEAQIAIKLFGNDLSTLYNKGTEIKNAIHGIDGVVDVNIEQQINRPQIEIKPRRAMLSQYGISLKDFSQFVKVAFGGTEISQMYENGYPYSVIVKVDPNEYDEIESIGNILIDSRDGKVALAEVAEIISSTGPNTINREDVNRRIVISANVEGRDLRGTVNEMRKAINEKVNLPEGYMIKIGGQFESEASATRTLMLLSILSIIVIFMLLYGEFKRLNQSLLILVNMPLALIGGVFMLVFTGAELNIPAIIGFISLMGISTRNGMLLINRYNQLKSEHVALKERVMQGSVDRLTPIMMTALTSAFALIPLALRGGEAGNEIQAPMATVILGGLITSTVLNLIVVPLLYIRIENKNEKA